jgi:acetyl-CoA/propionyl-CoA carboxylase biotin carboxyl carrier protein
VALSLRRVLVANRGEVAVRIVRACHSLGLEAVVACSDADATSMAVEEADGSVRLGPPPAADSYLSVPRVVAAARRSGCDAVHPGYGFLSEQPELAEACAAAGVTFVGASPAALRRLGDKAAAKELAGSAGFATVPGAARPEDVPLPLLVKAAAGGGGRGLRVVRRPEELAEAVAAAAREAAAAFGDPALLFERYLEGARHVEVQALADAHGAATHLGLRDCSLQRRHQKVVEEAPAPGVDADEVERLGAAAARLLRAAAYTGVATVELLRTPDGAVHFLEVNARLQVEHPVTELVTGQDVVVWQLRLAAGGALPEDGLDAAPHGHAVEARLVAEDPDRGFLPTAGRLLRLDLPHGPGLRVDAGYRSGDDVTTHYDGLLAKIVAHGPTRGAALARLRDALDVTVVVGVQTNLPLLRALAVDPDVVAGRLDTGLVERRPWPPAPPDPPAAVRRAAAAFAAREGHRDPFAGRFRIGLGGTAALPTARAPDGALHVLHDGRDHRLAPVAAPDVEGSAQERSSGAGPSVVIAPMPGRVLAVRAEAGDRVGAGEPLVTLEAMKMEHPVPAPYPCTIRAVLCEIGDQVSGGAPLVEIESL